MLSAVCLAGAGLTYGSIFSYAPITANDYPLLIPPIYIHSATRGNIRLMIWSFSLFIIALSTFLGAQCFIMWASNLVGHRPSTAVFYKIWQSVLVFSLHFAAAVVTAAVVLLVVGVLDLHYDYATVAPLRSDTKIAAIVALLVSVSINPFPEIGRYSHLISSSCSTWQLRY